MKMVNTKTILPALLLMGTTYLGAQEANIPTVDLGNLGQNTFGTEKTIELEKPVIVKDQTPIIKENLEDTDKTAVNNSLEEKVIPLSKSGSLLSATEYQPLTEYSQFWEVMGLPSTYTLETHAQPITDFQETFGLPPSPSYNVNKEDSPLTIPLINYLYKMLTAYNADELLLIESDNSSDALYNKRLGDVANKLFNIDRRDQNDLSEKVTAVSRHGLYIAAVSHLLKDPVDFRDNIKQYSTIIKDDNQVPESTYNLVEAISYSGEITPYWTKDLRTAVKDLLHEDAAHNLNMPRSVYNAIVNSETMNYTKIVDQIQGWMKDDDLVFAKISSRDYGFIPREQAESGVPLSIHNGQTTNNTSLDQVIVGNQPVGNQLVQYISNLSAIDQNGILENYMGIADDATPLQRSSAIAQFQQEMGLLNQSGRISGDNRLQLIEYAANTDPELLTDIVKVYQQNQ